MISRGIAFILIATLAFAGMNSLAKELSDFHPMQVVFFRCAGSLIFILPYMLYNRVPIIGNKVKFLLLRAVVGAVSLACFFIAVQRIPLGSAISIRYVGPIFGAMLAAYFLKEKINFLQWLSFAIAFTGVVVLKGFDLRIDSLSLFLLLFSALLVGGVFVLIRYLTAHEHYLTIINYFMTMALLMSLFFMGAWRMPLDAEWNAVLGIGVLGLIGQIFMTRAFQTEETSVLAPFKYMELVYALIIGFFFFGEVYEWLPMFGIVLIIAGMLMNVSVKGTAESKF